MKFLLARFCAWLSGNDEDERDAYRRRDRTLAGIETAHLKQLADVAEAERERLIREELAVRSNAKPPLPPPLALGQKHAPLVLSPDLHFHFVAPAKRPRAAPKKKALPKKRKKHARP